MVLSTVMGLVILLLFGLRAPAATLLNTAVVDASLFRVTQYAAGLALANEMVLLPDNSLLVATLSGIYRYTDTNGDGVADGAGVSVYATSAGALTVFKQAGAHYAVGEYGSTTIRFLQPGASPSDTLTSVGQLQFTYPEGWEHNSIGFTSRPAGNATSIDFYFNVGSQYNAQTSTSTVSLNGLGLAATLNGDSIYAVTIDQSGAVPIASNLRLVASGIRNVYGMGFRNGDLYFGDNAIDLRMPPFEDPPQADELNRITAAQLAANTPLHFGYPNCYPDYVTGAAIGGPACAGVEQPVVAFTPVSGSQSEGVAGLAFSPPGFPAAFADGVFLGFAGGVFGDQFRENPVLYYDFPTGQYIQFIAEANPLTRRPISILAAPGSLFVSDFVTGDVWQIAVADIPEPGTLAAGLVALVAMLVRRVAAS